jgi:hypothetical protein
MVAAIPSGDETPIPERNLWDGIGNLTAWHDACACSSGFSRGIDREFTRLKNLQERYRSDCAQWSWIGWGKN